MIDMFLERKKRWKIIAIKFCFILKVFFGNKKNEEE